MTSKKVARLKALLPQIPYKSPETVADRAMLMDKALEAMPPSLIENTLLQIDEKNLKMDRETIEAHIRAFERNGRHLR